MKNFQSKKHYYYKIHTSLMKSSVLPPYFMPQPPSFLLENFDAPFYDFSKTSNKHTASTNGRFLKNLYNADRLPVISYHANLASKYLNVSVKQEMIKIQLMVPHSLKHQRNNLSLLPLISIYPFTSFIFKGVQNCFPQKSI